MRHTAPALARTILLRFLSLAFCTPPVHLRLPTCLATAAAFMFYVVWVCISSSSGSSSKQLQWEVRQPGIILVGSCGREGGAGGILGGSVGSSLACAEKRQLVSATSAPARCARQAALVAPSLVPNKAGLINRTRPHGPHGRTSQN